MFLWWAIVFAIFLTVKGDQAWDIRDRVFYTKLLNLAYFFTKHSACGIKPKCMKSGPNEKKIHFLLRSLSHLPRWDHLVWKTRVQNFPAWVSLRWVHIRGIIFLGISAKSRFNTLQYFLKIMKASLYTYWSISYAQNYLELHTRGYNIFFFT